jgi:hypothetical protein
MQSLRDTFAADSFTSVFPRIHSLEVAATELQKLKTIAGRNLVGRDERLDQALQSIAALNALAEHVPGAAAYELQRHEPEVLQALDNRALSAGAASILSRLATAKAQTALVDFASQLSRPIEARQVAANAFAAAVKRRGLGLAQTQVEEQYHRYNAGAAYDKPTQAVLGSVLDTIESGAVSRGELSKSN